METDRLIQKVLPNGWIVPYPDELVYQNMLFLKDYRLNDYPGSATGCFDETLDYYAWLADYLYGCAVELTPEQAYFSNYISTQDSFSTIMLGFIAGLYESCQALKPAYDFPDNFEEVPDIDAVKSRGGALFDPYADYLEWLADSDEPSLSKIDFVLDDYGYCLTMQRDKQQFENFWSDFVKLEPLHWMFGQTEQQFEPPDAAWRVYLSCILKKIPDRAERIQQIERFFFEYGDTLHK